MVVTVEIHNFGHMGNIRRKPVRNDGKNVRKDKSENKYYENQISNRKKKQ